MKVSLFELERQMMPWDQLASAPAEVQRAAHESSADGTPTGFGRHDTVGWYVLWTAGQGPDLAYAEHPELIAD